MGAGQQFTGYSLGQAAAHGLDRGGLLDRGLRSALGATGLGHGRVALVVVRARLPGDDLSALSADREGDGGKMIKSHLVRKAQRELISGANIRWVGCEPSVRQRVYFANPPAISTAVVIWAASARSGALTRPVAARDYWTGGRIRPYPGQPGCFPPCSSKGTGKPTARDNPLSDHASGSRRSAFVDYFFPRVVGKPAGEWFRSKSECLSPRQRPA